MQYITLALATLASVVAAQGPNFRFTSYSNGDTTCDPANVLPGAITVPGTGPLRSSIQFPIDTSSIYYELLEPSDGGYKVELFTNPSCIGPAIKAFTPAVGEHNCVPPVGAGWECVTVSKNE